MKSNKCNIGCICMCVCMCVCKWVNDAAFVLHDLNWKYIGNQIHEIVNEVEREIWWTVYHELLCEWNDRRWNNQYVY